MLTLIDCFEKYKGTQEYDGIVATIQEWYYGKMVKDSWCATSLSYFAYCCGILDQLGGKNEGVWEMYNACKKACAEGKGGKFYDYGNIPATIPKQAVVFFLRKDASHVSVCYADRHYNTGLNVSCIGGNQNDMICVKAYSMAKIQAIFIPDYSIVKKPTIKEGYNDSEKGGEWCRYLQRSLNQIDGAGLKVDGKCGPKTVAAITAFQSEMSKTGWYKSTIDGKCGPKTWGCIDRALEANIIYVKTIPASQYVYSEKRDGYYYIPALDVWVR